MFFFICFLKLFFVLCVFKAFSHSLILFKVKVRVKVMVMVMIRVRVRVKVRVRVRVVRVRAKVRVRVKLGTMYSESGFLPSPSLFQNHVLTGVTLFEVYVSDVIGRRFEKVKTGHIFKTLDADLRIGRRLETGRRSESYIFIHLFDSEILLII